MLEFIHLLTEYKWQLRIVLNELNGILASTVFVNTPLFRRLFTLYTDANISNR